jgi:hypothetical protein
MRLKIKKTLEIVEVIGIGVLVLVSLALLDINYSSLLLTPTMQGFTRLMQILVIVSLIMSPAHLANSIKSETGIKSVPVWIKRIVRVLQKCRTIFGVIILAVGASVFFALPEYFSTLINAPLDFWILVSIYSLPAICVEGGLFTLFTEFLEHERRIKTHEYVWLSVVFLLYIGGSVTANFLVIQGVLTVENQVIFARFIVIASIIIGALVVATHSKTTLPQP